jgi:hypothetical protein
MISRLILYRLLMYGVCGYALFRGKTEARIVASVFLVADIATLRLRSSTYSSMETSILVIDIPARRSYPTASGPCGSAGSS